MGSILDKVFLDNSLRSYIIVAGSLLVIFLLKRLMSRYLAGLLYGFVSRVSKGVDKKSFVKLVVSPLEIFLLLLLSVIVVNELTFPKAINVVIYKATVHEFIDAITTIVLIITFISLLLRVMDFIAMILHLRSDQTSDPADNQLIVFFKDFFKALLVIIGILMILKFAFSYDISALLTSLSIAAAAFALATRESLENLIASFIIFFDKPFTMGDIVKVNNIQGTVERIGLRSTRIRTDEKTYVTVPNKQMVDSIMDNLSLRTQRRVLQQIELHADTSHDNINQFVQRAKNIFIQKKEKVENYSVFLLNISKNAFVIQVEFFTAPIPVANFNELRQEINLALIKLMEELNVKLVAKDADLVR